MVLTLLLLGPISAFAQSTEVRASPLTDDDIRLLREDVQSIKDQVIKNTMQFTTAESAVFWPVYRKYSLEYQAIATKRLSLITEYAQNLDHMDNAKASSLTERFLQIEDDTQALRRRYFPMFKQTLGAKRAAKFYQVDNRLTMIVNIQLASEIPLIP